ncbi:MAG TPA: GspH/FimT family pseudopilin [Steroidobacteraceae bacterium]
MKIRQVSRSAGFTLTELMIVLALAALILAIGAPNFTLFRLNLRLSNTANDLLSAITLARSTAIQRQTRIALCPSANPEAEDAVCTPGATQGWIVFQDSDQDCERGEEDEVLAASVFDQGSPSQPLYIKSDGDCIAFAPTGFRVNIKDKTTDRILICDHRGISQPGMEAAVARGILITRTGRARVTRDRTSGSVEDISRWGLSCS